MSPLSSDKPQTDPAGDLFGHAPFAKNLADSIRRQQGSDGIVLALYGPWGAGKSTVLSYVLHYLELATPAERPVIVPFNPWWFSGQENLARAFLGQLQAVLPEKYAQFREIGKKLSEFSEAIGGATEVAGAAIGMPVPGGVVKAGLRLLGGKPKDVPALKKALSALLLKEAKRVLVVIDDIDRLAPDEVRQLFTVIKALADFPYVTYLLAFDRTVASEAISTETRLPGDRYLEKIIQVPFELPPVDRVSLRKALFAKLDVIMKATPAGRFDSAHWQNIFFSGVDQMIQVPRDMVRLINTLSVTFQAVSDEVNPVDFIAIEALRVFLPKVYEAIRLHPEEFIGYRAPDDNGKKKALAYHNSWLGLVPDHLRESTKDLIERLFPKLESVFSNMHYSADSAAEWRRKLRICSPEIFPAYLRLALPDGALRRTELDQFLALASNPEALGTALTDAAKVIRPDGLSKARALLERTLDHLDDIPLDAIPSFIQALFAVGDELLLESDSPVGSFDFGNESRITRLTYHLVKRLEKGQRAKILADAVAAGTAVRCSEYLVQSLSEESEKAAKDGSEALLNSEDVNTLKTKWLDRIRGTANLIAHPHLARLLAGWRSWASVDEVKQWWTEAASTDEGLATLISAFESKSTSTTFGDYATRVQIRVNPKGIAHYGDVQAMSGRLQKAMSAGKIAEDRTPAVKQFILECQMMAAGQDPDAPFAFNKD